MSNLFFGMKLGLYGLKQKSLEFIRADVSCTILEL